MNKPMSKRAETALRKSIEHWKRLEACETRAEVKVEGLGRGSCALCELYIDNSCMSCPVARKTGLDGCHGTPYEDADYYYCVVLSRDFDPARWQPLARAERKFLESLLPEAA